MTLERILAGFVVVNLLVLGAELVYHVLAALLALL